MGNDTSVTDGESSSGRPGPGRWRFPRVGWTLATLAVVTAAMLLGAGRFGTGQFELGPFTMSSFRGAGGTTDFAQVETRDLAAGSLTLPDATTVSALSEAGGSDVGQVPIEPAAGVSPKANGLGDPALWRISIPSIAVAASMTSLGVDSTGIMQVPHDASTVGWYRFTSTPGAPGNVVLAAHVDYRGSPAVFSRLASLGIGDQVVVHAGGSTYIYAVEQVTLVRPEIADVKSIVGTRAGPPTMTLITCGGSWDRARGDYDHRVIVTTSLVRSERGT
jgi:LPXTG-site transpeptidase (sortase) family protein